MIEKGASLTNAGVKPAHSMATPSAATDLRAQSRLPAYSPAEACDAIGGPTLLFMLKQLPLPLGVGGAGVGAGVGLGVRVGVGVGPLPQ